MIFYKYVNLKIIYRFKTTSSGSYDNNQHCSAIFDCGATGAKVELKDPI